MPVLNIPHAAKSYASKQIVVVTPPTTTAGAPALASVFVYCNDEAQRFVCITVNGVTIEVTEKSFERIAEAVDDALGYVGR